MQLQDTSFGSDNKTNTAGIYLHIPFCKQACVYCNFHFSTSLKHKDDLIKAMLLELEIQQHVLNDAPVTTIYFGGGTPSLLTSYEINTLIDAIFKSYNVSGLIECTLETNPDDLNQQYLQSLITTPINRLSIGVQSFKEEDLTFMKRSHNAQQAIGAIKNAQDAGFKNLSIDFIYGTPNLTNDEWLANLEKLTDLNIPHFSAYALTVEEKTLLHANITRKKSLSPDPELAATQFELLLDFAGNNNYDHYEISNFAKPGCNAVHNTNYWRGNHYLGVGPSAHSFNGSSRQWNVANNALYTKSLLKNNILTFESETLTSSQQLNEYIMTSLRTMWGCDTNKIEQHWGADYAKAVLTSANPYLENGALTLANGTLLLTANGKLFADRIASELFI